jgi:hypothetical protein
MKKTTGKNCAVGRLGPRRHFHGSNFLPKATAHFLSFAAQQQCGYILSRHGARGGRTRAQRHTLVFVADEQVHVSGNYGMRWDRCRDTHHQKRQSHILVWWAHLNSMALNIDVVSNTLSYGSNGRSIRAANLVKVATTRHIYVG